MYGKAAPTSGHAQAGTYAYHVQQAAKYKRLMDSTSRWTHAKQRHAYKQQYEFHTARAAALKKLAGKAQSSYTSPGVATKKGSGIVSQADQIRAAYIAAQSAPVQQGARATMEQTVPSADSAASMSPEVQAQALETVSSATTGISGLSTGAKVALGAGVLAALGGVAYYAKKKHWV